MKDPRLEQLAGRILDHSLALTPQDAYQISASVEALPLVQALLRASVSRQLMPVLEWHEESTERMRAQTLNPADPETERFLDAMTRVELDRWEHLKGRVVLRAANNSREAAALDADRQRFLAERSAPLRDRIINERRWVLFQWPTPAQAQAAGMTTEAFFDYTLDVCDIDYAALYTAELSLAAKLERADRVHIEGPDTDLSFSIRDIPVVCSHGLRNLPDGEVFTAPVAGTAEGSVRFNVPTLYRGQAFRDVRLELSRGRIVSASCDGDEDALRAILATDEGAGQPGEFALGVNPKLSQPTGSILFDEKISGSFHFTPGQAYARADNGNRSAIHWDMVCIQRPEYGGGRILLDGQVLREDGVFTDPGLAALNPVPR